MSDKSIHECKLEDEAKAKVAFAEFGLNDINFSHEHRYLGGFLGSADDEHKWIGEAIEIWTGEYVHLQKLQCGNRRRHMQGW